MAGELRCCPFCGGEAHAALAAYASGATAHVVCDACGAKVYGYGRGERGLRDAVESWNRRAERTCRIVVSVDRNPASYGGRVHRCSSCGKALPGSLFRNGWTKLDYCPRCGARVTEEVRDAD